MSLNISAIKLPFGNSGLIFNSGLDPGMMNQGGMGQPMVGGGMSVNNPAALTMAGGTMTMTNGESFRSISTIF